MRLFGVGQDNRFVEYEEKQFKDAHVEQTLESWLEANPDSILEDSKLLVIGRQVTTNLNSVIDLLGLDRRGNTVIVELKRGRTPRDVLAQALEYAACVAPLKYQQLETMLSGYTGQQGPPLSEQHREFFELSEGETVTFNDDQRIVIVAGEVTADVRQTAAFLRQKGLRVTCVEFDYFETGSGERLVSTDTVVGKESVDVTLPLTTQTLPRVNREQFLASCDDVGRPLFETILDLAEPHGLPIHWGSKGFSLNVAVNGKHIALWYGYPPSSVFRQTLRTAFWDISHNIAQSADLMDAFRVNLEQSGLFVRAGNEMKIPITGNLSDQHVDVLKGLVLGLAKRVKERATQGNPEERI